MNLRGRRLLAGYRHANGNAYIEGLSAGWDPVKQDWNEPTEENRNALRAVMALQNQRVAG